MTLVETMQRLYKHEINCGVSSFWDGGFKLFIGDYMNGEKASQDLRPAELDNAGPLLWDMAVKLYPQLLAPGQSKT